MPERTPRPPYSRPRSGPRGWAIGALMALAVAAACRRAGPRIEGSSERGPNHDATAAGATVGKGASDGGAPLAPLSAEWIEQLELPEGGLAVVTPPAGATEPRPVIIAVHGAVDEPGGMCSAWRLIVDVYAFVVCPAGTPMQGSPRESRKYVWGSSDQIERRALEALEALVLRYGDHVAKDAPVIYAAFSQGATLSAPLLVRRAKRFSRAVLTEGGYRAFESPGVARAYANMGGERVLFTCSQAGCAPHFEGSRAALAREHVGARVVDAGPYGHSLPPPAREAIHAALPWLVEGLAGWEGYAASNKLAHH